MEFLEPSGQGFGTVVIRFGCLYSQRRGAGIGALLQTRWREWDDGHLPCQKQAHIMLTMTIPLNCSFMQLFILASISHPETVVLRLSPRLSPTVSLYVSSPFDDLLDAASSEQNPGTGEQRLQAALPRVSIAIECYQATSPFKGSY